MKYMFLRGITFVRGNDAVKRAFSILPMWPQNWSEVGLS